MKKLIYSISIYSLLLMGASCTHEALAPLGDSAAVEFRISIPEATQTRAEGGNLLKWSVFEIKEDTEKALVDSDKEEVALSGSKTEVPITLRLLQGHKYQVAFAFLDSGSSFAEFNDGVLTVDYASTACNSGEDDVFIGKSTVLTVAGESVKTDVELHRPFAQLNWSTSDLGVPQVSKNLADISASVTVSGEIFKSLDIIDGNFSDKIDGDLTFPSTAMPETSTISDETAYCNIASNYLLIKGGDDQPAINCSLHFGGYADVTVDVNNAPVQTNYRTNILGALLTNEKQVTISMEKGFSNSSYTGFSEKDVIENILAGNDLTVAQGKTVDLRRFERIPLKAGQTITVNGSLLVGKNTFVINQPGEAASITGSGTINLSDVSSNVFEIGKEGSLDISNVTFSKTAKSTTSEYMITVNGGTLNATNAKFNVKTGVFKATNAANVNLTECNVSITQYNYDYLSISESKCCFENCNFKIRSILYIENNTELTIKGDKTYYEYLGCIFNISGNAKLNIEGGKFFVSSASSIALNINKNVTITGGFYNKRFHSSYGWSWVNIPEGYELITNSTTYSGYPYEVRKKADAE